MKRFCLLVFLIVAACALVGCGTTKADSPHIGTWEATAVAMEGLELPLGDALPGGFILELKSGGVYTMTSDGETGEGTWSGEGNDIVLDVVEEGSEDFTIKGVVDGDTLTFDDFMGMQFDLIFKRATAGE